MNGKDLYEPTTRGLILNKKSIADRIIDQFTQAVNPSERTKIWIYARSISTGKMHSQGQLYYWFSDSSCYHVTMSYILEDF